MAHLAKEELDGFKIGEVGYGFDEDGFLYSYKRDIETDSMANLFKTRKEAILNEIKKSKKFIEELKRRLDE